jgi:thymidylate synthase
MTKYADIFTLQQQVLEAINGKLSTVYGIGDLFWNVSSLHVYERHFKLVEDEDGEYGPNA